MLEKSFCEVIFYIIFFLSSRAWNQTNGDNLMTKLLKVCISGTKTQKHKTIYTENIYCINASLVIYHSSTKQHIAYRINNKTKP